MRLFRLLALAVAVTLSTCAFAQDHPIRGYRGFVDGGVHVGVLRFKVSDFLSSFYGEAEWAHYNRLGISTTHGYQFNPHFFLGGGVEWQIYPGDEVETEDLESLFAAYANFRYDMFESRISPFASARIGGYTSLTESDFSDLGGAYFNVNVGARIGRLNLSVGYECMPGSATGQGQYANSEYDMRLNSFVFRAGVDIGRRTN